MICNPVSTSIMLFLCLFARWKQVLQVPRVPVAGSMAVPPPGVSLRRHQCPSQWAKAGGRWAGESMALIDFHGAWEKWFSSWNIFCPWSFCWNMNAVVFFEWGIYFGETLYYNHARLHRILQKSILQLNWKKKSHRIFGFWGEVFFVWKLRSVRMFFQLLAINRLSFVPGKGPATAGKRK